MHDLWWKKAKKGHFWRIYDVTQTDDVILRIWKLYHWLRWLISYGIGYEICTKNGTNRVKIAEICVFGRFPIFPNTKCLYKGVFAKTSFSTPLPPTQMAQTKIFLKLWHALHTLKIGAMLPPPKIFLPIKKYDRDFGGWDRLLIEFWLNLDLGETL